MIKDVAVIAAAASTTTIEGTDVLCDRLCHLLRAGSGAVRAPRVPSPGRRALMATVVDVATGTNGSSRCSIAVTRGRQF
jgi:hypothetical protein